MSSLVDSGTSGMELWSSALQTLERKYSKPVYEMWLRPIRPVSVTGSEIVLAVATPFARDWVENRLRPHIVEALRALLGYEIEVSFVVASDERPDEPPAVHSAADGAAGAARASVIRNAHTDELRVGNLNVRYTFDEFVVGNSNRFAHAASQAVAEAPARAYNPLFLYGGVGDWARPI